jgi:hypothetical protein
MPIEQLLEIGSEPLASGDAVELKPKTPPEYELRDVLERKNGFYAFESALHFFPSGETVGQCTLEEWNSHDLWRRQYGSLADHHLFFAEDLFGGQFSIKGGMVFTFDPETGDSEPFADQLDAWADALLADYDVLTGFPLAHEWQMVHGPIPMGMRLIPKQPFALGGAFSIENLYLGDAVEGMRLRADIARQLERLPDGTRVAFRLTD